MRARNGEQNRAWPGKNDHPQDAAGDLDGESTRRCRNDNQAVGKAGAYPRDSEESRRRLEPSEGSNAPERYATSRGSSSQSPSYGISRQDLRIPFFVVRARDSKSRFFRMVLLMMTLRHDVSIF
jgi:hypothetical protein